MSHIMDAYFDEIVASTVKAIQFDTSMRPAEDNYPFGKETADCLAWFLGLAESFGFQTHNYDNYIGEVVFGSGEDFAVLAHLDVVPAGSGWKYPPFGGVINDDISAGGVTGKKIWGRGTMDDKTPAIVCLYALKALKDSGFTPKRTIKLIVGCNEEAGWKCIEHYNQVAVMPNEGFTPDANFPVIYAEKGIYHFEASFPIKNSPFYQLKAGERVNMVCDYAEALITRKTAEALVNYQNPIFGTTLSYDNSTNILKAYGKSAHGSTPDKGANALQAMLYFFAQINEDCKKAYDALFTDIYGLKDLEDETGKLTLSPDIAVFEDGVLKISCDTRFPATLALQTVQEKLSALDIQTLNYQAPLYNDPNGTLISTLTKVYNDATGKAETPIAIGGGTYARALKCGSAFGPEICGEEDTIHQPNEYVTFERIKLMSELYFNALKEISKPQYIKIATLKPVRK